MLLELTQSLLFKPVQYVKICSLYMVSVSTTCPALICVSRLVVGCAPNMRTATTVTSPGVGRTVTSTTAHQQQHLACTRLHHARLTLVANLRVDQAWGSAQIMGALHQVNATYYGGNNAPITGHPGDELGVAIGAGIKLNAPMISQGEAQINYTQGALRYIFQTPNSNWGKVSGADTGFGVLSDAIYGGCVITSGTCIAGTASDLDLTTAWNVNVAFEHFWNPQCRTALYGGYAAVSYTQPGVATDGSVRGPNGTSARICTWASTCCTQS